MLRRHKKTTTKSAKDYERLGRMLESIFQTEYVSRHEMFKMSLIRGLITGFGGVLGATILVALLIWILSLFNHVPLIGPLIDNIQDTVKTQQD
jgi:hypothetical protein